MKCLVIGNFTVDLVDNVEKIGGSSYYSSWSLKQLGCEVYVLSTISNKYRDLYRELYSVFNIVEYSCLSNPVFIIRDGRAIGLKEPGCAISPSLVNEVFETINPDIVLFTPVFRELDLGDERLCNLLCSDVVKSLEIHGLTRDVYETELVNKWIIDLFKYFKFFNIVHGNLFEYCFSADLLIIINKLREYSSMYKTYFQVSLDNRGLYLVGNGSIHYIYPFVEEELNILGAGDVLLAVTTYYLAKGFNPLEATIRGLTASYLKMKSTGNEWFNKETIEKNIDIVKYMKFN